MLKKILVIEDAKDVAHLLQLHLEDAGHEVTLAYDGQDGLQQALSNQYDLIILDLMLPKMDGLEICRRLQSTSHNPPILMLSAKSSELDRVLGLEVGADDYLTKPFSIRELLARVKALLRRMEGKAEGSSTKEPRIIQVGEISIDIARRYVAIDGKPVPNLTRKEFELLLQFAEHPGRVYTRAQLLDLVWGYGFEGYEHTVNSHINRLRAKIEKNQTAPRLIVTVWGIGYKFADLQTREQ